MTEIQELIIHYKKQLEMEIVENTHYARCLKKSELKLIEYKMMIANLESKPREKT